MLFLGLAPGLMAGEPASAASFLTRGPYLQNGTPNSVVVRWRTSVAIDSQVRFGLNPNALNHQVLDEELVTEHVVTLSELLPDTKYYYSIGTSVETLASGDDYFFLTMPASGKPTRIWVIGDSGTASTGAKAVYNRYREFTGDRYTDLWLMLGDNAYGIGTDVEYTRAVFDMYPELLRQTMLWSTMGNHETYSTEPNGSHAYFNIFSLPTAGEAGGTPSGTEHYYSFNYGNIHFVCLDSEESGRSLGSPMLTWLEEDLAANTNDWLIAFWHSPPYSMGSHNSDDLFDNGGNMTDMRANILPILESYGVDLVLCGHSHNYERSFLLDGHYGFSSTLTPLMIKDAGSGRADESGAYLKSGTGANANQGAVYVVAGSSGWATFQHGHHPAMHTSLLRMGSLVLDVDGPRLDAKFLRETGAIDDYFTILKGSTSEAVRIATFWIRDEMIQAQFKSQPGRRYRVQRTLSLTTPDWENASDLIVATGVTTSWSAPAEPGTAESYYRVVQVD
jgi:3',5'-cyclic AMP phosphodiesterase CpdA